MKFVRWKRKAADWAAGAYRNNGSTACQPTLDRHKGKVAHVGANSEKVFVFFLFSKKTFV